jgi:2-polyprenyl-3-methyl-5-hydroxy-6-metoxy-1,4-benzoquinol methylase
MTTEAFGTCLLCGSGPGDVLLEVPYEAVWERFEADWGVVISSAVRDRAAPVAVSTLVRCPDCGLERFEPVAPGDPDFYGALMTATPYAEDRWDFVATRRQIHPADDVVDFGSGEGRFLSSLGSRPGRTTGVDHNRDAVERFVQRGGEAYACSFSEFAAGEAERFDVVTSFHTLEHLGDPIAMVRSAARCLRRGGRLFLSVPNRERTWRDEGEPMDRPPHHVTRWGPEQLRRLAEICDLQLMDITFEPPGLRQADAQARASAEARLRWWPRPVRVSVGGVQGALAVGRAWRDHRTGGDTFARKQIYGHTMLAVLQRA